jgi:hypothetical protein
MAAFQTQRVVIGRDRHHDTGKQPSRSHWGLHLLRRAAQPPRRNTLLRAATQMRAELADELPAAAAWLNLGHVLSWLTIMEFRRARRCDLQVRGFWCSDLHTNRGS